MSFLGSILGLEGGGGGGYVSWAWDLYQGIEKGSDQINVSYRPYPYGQPPGTIRQHTSPEPEPPVRKYPPPRVGPPPPIVGPGQSYGPGSPPSDLGGGGLSPYHVPFAAFVDTGVIAKAPKMGPWGVALTLGLIGVEWALKRFNELKQDIDYEEILQRERDRAMQKENRELEAMRDAQLQVEEEAALARKMAPYFSKPNLGEVKPIRGKRGGPKRLAKNRRRVAVAFGYPPQPPQVTRATTFPSEIGRAHV